MTRSKPSAAARAEAAAWVARLHGPNRTPEVEAGFRRWMGEDPERAVAVELLTDTWEKTARLRRGPLEEVKSWERPGFRVRFSHAAAATAVIVAVAVVTTVLSLRSDRLATGVGELRTLSLEDGTRVHLNTDTRVVPRYDEKSRRIELERGEAFFEVAKSGSRPFIVTAGGHQIRALGTSFAVRRGARNLAVTLVEGKVSVSARSASKIDLDGSGTAAPILVKSDASRESPGSLILEPGQRVTLRMAPGSAELAAGQLPSIDPAGDGLAARPGVIRRDGAGGSGRRDEPL
jgi:ferric-dicitrate binding protein FerR (iron transport regulator)